MLCSGLFNYREILCPNIFFSVKKKKNIEYIFINFISENLNLMHNHVSLLFSMVWSTMVFFFIHRGTKIHIPWSFFYHESNLHPCIDYQWNGESSVCWLQVRARSAPEAFTMLIRPVEPWDKCITTAASPAVPVVGLQLMYQFRCREILDRADDMSRPVWAILQN